jgi:hypothetical protein
MPHSIERTLPLARTWRYLCDTLSLARPSPTVRIQRRISLADVAVARALAFPCPSWQAVFLKAFAHVSAANPLLRRCFLSWPWPRVYEHSETIATVPAARPGEIGFIRLVRPESLRLVEIDEALSSATDLIRLSGLPLRVGAAWSGHYRARKFGTLSVTTASLHAPFIPALHHGSISANGEVDVSLTYDHRVLDGIDAARVLSVVEDSLHERILTELRYLESVEAA